MDLGLQLFGCMPLFRENPGAFLESVAAMGYTNIEPCIAFTPVRLDGFPVDPFWSLAELDRFAPMAIAAGLRIDSCHAFGDLLSAADTMRQALAAHRIRRVVINGPAAATIADESGYTDTALSIAAALAEIDASLSIHNNAKEQTLQSGDSSWLERILIQCQGHVGAQLDVGWALYAGQNPAAYMRRLGKSLWSVHYKDIKPDFAALPTSAIHIRLGSGCLDVQSVIAAAKELAIPELIDQDKSDEDLLQDLNQSARLLESHAQRT